MLWISGLPGGFMVTPRSLDSTRIETPKRTKQAFRGRFLELPTRTSTPASRTERQSIRTPQSRNPPVTRTERQSARTPQGRNPPVTRTERQSARTPQGRNLPVTRTDRQSARTPRTPQGRNPPVTRTEHQSARTPQGRNPPVTRTERQSARTPRTPQGRNPLVTRTERQSARTPRTPQGRNSKEKQDKFPMTDKRFQRKVLTQFIEIKEELRRIGKNVEPDTVFHLSTLGTEEDFQYLERQLESENTRAAMVTKLCKIGGKNLKDSAKRMLDSVFKNSLMSKFNMKGGGPLQKEAFQTTALFSVIREERNRDFTTDNVNLTTDISREMIKDTFSSHVMKIIVLSRSVEEEDASMSDVIIVIEGTEVLLGCKNLANACLSLMGCIYSLNLSYPPKLRNTFEVFQKIFLGLDALKFSPKVNSLHRKILM